jgi:hypothetical protein
MSNAEVVCSEDSTLRRISRLGGPGFGACRSGLRRDPPFVPSNRPGNGVAFGFGARDLGHDLPQFGVVFGPKGNHRAKLAPEAVANDYPVDRWVWKRGRCKLAGFHLD